MCVFTVHAHRLIYMRYERLLCVRMNASIDYDWLNYSHVDDDCRCGSRPSLSSPQPNRRCSHAKRMSALARGAIPLISFIIYCHYIYFWHLFFVCALLSNVSVAPSPIRLLFIRSQSFNVRCPNTRTCISTKKNVSTRHSMQIDRYKVNWMWSCSRRRHIERTFRDGFSRTHFAFVCDGIF